jgi:hypothetical protein
VQVVGKYLIRPIIGIGDGASATADTPVTNLSGEHQVVKSTIDCLGFFVDQMLADLWDLF